MTFSLRLFTFFLVLVSGAHAADDDIRLTRENRVLQVVAISDDIIRVRQSDLMREHDDRSFAVDLHYREAATRRVTREGGSVTLKTAHLTVVIDARSWRVEIFDQNGVSIDQDDERGVQYHDDTWSLVKRLRDDENIFGFGEKTGHLNKRGVNLGGYHYTMWNSDTYGYDSSTDPIYVSVPFYMVLRHGNAHGIFLDNTHRTSFDIGKAHRGQMAWSADGGELDYYFIAGPDPKSVVTRYGQLTGKMPLPPRWALGFHQSRWGYFPASRFRLLANTFREKKIPADTLWLDIDYLKGFAPFEWNRDYFPDPAAMIGDLKQQGFNVVTIVDAHPKKEIGYAPFDQGLAGDHFVKNPDGSLFEGPVWPSNDPIKPANSVFPDFTREKTRHWWGELHRELVQQGVAGIWNDMNEPAVWIAPHNTMPLNVQHQNDGQPTTQAEIHNVYGLLHTQATFEGLKRLRPDARPFVLSRANFAGGQKYTALWPGDNTADWSSLRQSLPMLMNMGVSGFSFVGTDIGGFVGTPSGELFLRWLQASVFAPFMRAHTEKNTPDQEPWSYGARFEDLNRRAIELRYQLLPMLYSEMEASSRSGLPVLRPLFLEFPHDAQTWQRNDQFMVGSDLLVAPVVYENAQQRDVYLPAGKWIDFWSGTSVNGGRTITVPVSLESLPIYVRAGAFIVQQPVVQHTGEMATQPMLISVYPATQSQGEYYVDGGDGYAYQNGDFARLHFTQTRNAKTIRVNSQRAQGQYHLTAPFVELRVRDANATHRVIHNGVALPATNDRDWPTARHGWRLWGNTIIIRSDDVNADHEWLLQQK